MSYQWFLALEQPDNPQLFNNTDYMPLVPFSIVSALMRWEF
jgi:hypothetical protein